MLAEIYRASRLEMIVVQSLARSIWPEAYGEILTGQQIDYMLDEMYACTALEQQMDAGHVFLLLKEGNHPLGFASYECNCKEGGTAKLHKIYLLPETQGRGLGKMLLNEVVLQAKQEGQQRLLLNVNRFNKALHFYQRYGFRIIAEEDIAIGKGYFMNDYLMEFLM